MSEQITDLIESVMPGPRGKQGPEGPRGLPGVNAVPADEAVAGYLEALDSKSHAAALKLVRGEYLVAFGDSITVGKQSGITSRWTSQVASRLGLEEHNYAVNGAAFGFERTDPRGNAIPVIGSQLTTAKTDVDVDPKRVGVVLVGAGVNDTEDMTKNDMSVANMREFLAGVRAYYPNARIVFNLGQGGLRFRKYGNDAVIVLYRRMMREAGQLGASVLPAWLMLWPYKPSDVLQSDGVHPSQHGHDLLASGVISAIESGQYHTGMEGLRFSAINDGTDWTVAFGREFLADEMLADTKIKQIAGRVSLDDNGYVHLELMVIVNSNSGNFEVPILNLPHWATQSGFSYGSGTASVFDSSDPQNGIDIKPAPWSILPGEPDTSNYTAPVTISVAPRAVIEGQTPNIKLDTTYPTCH